MRNERQDESFICCHCSPFRIPFSCHEQGPIVLEVSAEKMRFCVPIGGLRVIQPEDTPVFIASSFFSPRNYCAQSLNRKGNLINCLNYSGLSRDLSRASSSGGEKGLNGLNPLRSRNFNIFRLTALNADRHNVPACYRLDLLAIEKFSPSPPTDRHGYNVRLEIILRTLLSRNYRNFRPFDHCSGLVRPQ